MSTPTTSTFTQMVTAPLVAIGVSDDTPTKAHLWGMGLYAGLGGYILGVYRGKAKPSSNFLGF
jgi:hypothetical protein